MVQSTSFQTKAKQTLSFRAKQLESPIRELNPQPWKGLVISGVILTTWLVSFSWLLSINVSTMNLWMIAAAFIWQTFLYTGLFITAHDAMHGTVFPTNIRINHAIGALAVMCYGLFSYQDLLKKHWLHHKHPGTEHDPDFHRGNSFSLIWYLQFMKHYWSWRRMAALVLLFNGIHFFLHVPELNMLLFWVLPSILSSVQLFYFGTYLTHREPEGGYTNAHRAKSTNFSILWSFLTCYHFGYHQEHHEYPQAPWWQLPKIYQLRKKLSSQYG